MPRSAAAIAPPIADGVLTEGELRRVADLNACRVPAKRLPSGDASRTAPICRL